MRGQRGREAPLTWREICRRRLRAQHLYAPLPAASFHRMVADIAGLHAQVMSSAELAAAVRLDELRPGTIAAALWSDRSLVKTWAMRGTLHLLTTEDYPLYAAALSNRRSTSTGRGSSTTDCWRRRSPPWSTPSPTPSTGVS